MQASAVVPPLGVLAKQGSSVHVPSGCPLPNIAQLQLQAMLKYGTEAAAASTQVLSSKSPPVHVVITPNWWLNWFGPTFFPRHLVDKEIARRFRMSR